MSYRKLDFQEVRESYQDTGKTYYIATPGSMPTAETQPVQLTQIKWFDEKGNEITNTDNAVGIILIDNVDERKANAYAVLDDEYKDMNDVLDAADDANAKIVDLFEKTEGGRRHRKSRRSRNTKRVTRKKQKKMRKTRKH